MKPPATLTTVTLDVSVRVVRNIARLSSQAGMIYSLVIKSGSKVNGYYYGLCDVL
jgi:hypothetical protein